MCLNFQNNLSSTTHINYLSNCDLINKYNLTSVHHIPKLDRINLELNLKDFLEFMKFQVKTKLILLFRQKLL